MRNPEIVVTISPVEGSTKIQVVSDTAEERDDLLTRLSNILPTLECFENAIHGQYAAKV